MRTKVAKELDEAADKLELFQAAYEGSGGF